MSDQRNPRAAGSAGADPLDELRAAYHAMPAGEPAAEWVLERLARLYAAIEAVLAHNPCKELGKAYAELQERFIRFGEAVSTGADPEHTFQAPDGRIHCRCGLAEAEARAQGGPSVIDVARLAKAMRVSLDIYGWDLDEMAATIAAEYARLAPEPSLPCRLPPATPRRLSDE